MSIRPDYANIEGEDGKLEQVDPDDVEIGTVIVVQPGERVPIDGEMCIRDRYEYVCIITGLTAFAKVYPHCFWQNDRFFL